MVRFPHTDTYAENSGNGQVGQVFSQGGESDSGGGARTPSNGRRLTEEDAQAVQRLIGQGTEPKEARRKVLARREQA